MNFNFSNQVDPQVEKMVNDQINQMSDAEIKACAKKERGIILSSGIFLVVMLLGMCVTLLVLCEKPMELSTILTCAFCGGFVVFYLCLK